MTKDEIEESVENLLKHDKGEENAVKDIMEYIDEHQATFVSYFNNFDRGFVKHFEIGFDTLIESMNQINFEEKSSRPEQRTMQRLIIKNNLKTIFSSYNLLISGFYNDSISLTRSVFESVIRIIYVSYFPEERDGVLFNGKESKKFNITNFSTQTLKVDWHYKLLSIKSHSNSHDTLKDLVDINKNGQKGIINIKLEWDIEEMSLALNRLEFMLRNYTFFIKEFLLDKNLEYYNKLTDIERGFYGMFYSLTNTHPQNSFYNKCNEAIAIYEIMKEKEKAQIDSTIRQ